MAVSQAAQNLLDEKQVRIEDLPQNMSNEDDKVEFNMIFANLINENDDKRYTQLEVYDVVSDVTTRPPHGSPSQNIKVIPPAPDKDESVNQSPPPLPVASWHIYGLYKENVLLSQILRR